MDLKLHPKQSKAFTSPATEILYGGAAGGGKSYLLRVAALAWATAIPGLQVYLFRRLSSDLAKNHLEGPTGFPALLADWLNKRLAKINYSDHFIAFSGGSKIFLCHCQHEKDVIKYQGADIHLLLMDELTHFTEYIYRYLRGRVRLAGLTVPPKLAGRFPRIICGSNPGGLGHNWVKNTFISGAAPLDIRRMPIDEGGMLRQYIPAKLDDNPALADSDPDYVNRLAALGRPDLVRALRDGDWNIVAGGMFDDLWDERIHVVRPFPIPSSWRVDRAFDYGSSAPFSVGWWAESDGSEIIEPGGEVRQTVRGDLFRIAEWYGTSGKSNEGLRLLAADITAGIIERELSMGIHQRVKPGPADNSIWNTEDGNSIAASMAKPVKIDGKVFPGLRWNRSDKAPGSRKAGWEKLRRYLNGAKVEFETVADGTRISKPREHPGLFVFEHCRKFIDLFPSLPRSDRDPDDVNTDAEDHIGDETRYRVLSSGLGARTGRTVGLI